MIPFAPYLPDLAAFNTAASSQAENVVPSSSGFMPVAGLTATTTALTARAQGGISVRGLAGAISTFVGDATKLYKLAADGLSWTDVSRVSGGAYATPSDGWWDFTLFGDKVVAANGVDAPQVFQLDVASNFSALGGSPPIASFVGNIRDFAIMARKNTAWNRLQWSAINNVADWVPSSATMSDVQDFPDGGAIMGFVGGEYGVVLLERAIYRQAFEGPPTIFRFDRISNTLGCRVERSIATYQDLIFFLSNDGFYMIQGGSVITPIGNEKVDRTLETLLNESLLYRCSAAIDPIRKIYIFAFPTSASTGNPDRMLVYHWPTGQWSTIKQDVEIIFNSAVQSSYTLESLDALSSSLDALPFSLDSRFYTGSGRLLLSGFDATHKFGYFQGANLAAKIETGDTQLTPMKKSLLRSMRPMIEGTTLNANITIKSRDRLQDGYTATSPVAINSIGTCPVRVNARYHRAMLQTTAGDVWNFARGFDDIDFTPTGVR